MYRKSPGFVNSIFKQVYNTKGELSVQNNGAPKKEKVGASDSTLAPDRNADKHHIQVHLSDDMQMADRDARLIMQVVINIVNNAIKYTPEGSHITLSAKKSNRRVIAEIADDGPGISDEAKKKLFDMFYTANNKRVAGRWGVVSARSDDRDKVAALDAGGRQLRVLL